MAQLLDEGLELGPATVLVGENGAGESALVEAIGTAFGLAAEGGSADPNRHSRISESPLADHRHLVRCPGSSRYGSCLRAETTHSFFTFLEDRPRLPTQPRDLLFHEMSHGESFLALIEDRFRRDGLRVLDEPESALSSTGCMALLQHLVELTAGGCSQVVLPTRSPLLAALPGASVYEVGPWGYRRTAWEDLDLTRTWRAFLADPERFLRHLGRSS